MKHFAAKINWRQIVVHTIAIWFFAYAFQTLSYLFHLKIIDALNLHRLSGNEMIFGNATTTDDLNLFIVWRSLSVGIGLLTAFFVSLFLSIKRSWFWLNSFLSLILVILLLEADIWIHIKSIFYYPGQLFSNLFIEFLINGVLLLSVGSLLFFLKPITRFISGKQKTE